MFKSLIQRVVSSRSHRVWNDCSQHNKTLRCCYGSHRHRNCITYHQQPVRLDFARQMYSVVRIHDRRWALVCTNPTSVTLSLRSLTSDADSDKLLDQVHVDAVESDSFEEVAKELDAERTGSTSSRKAKRNSSNNIKASLSKDSMKSVGKLVPDRIVHLLDEAGESLGSLHRTEAIKRSQETGLKLVLINQNTKPYPTYRLMTGQQLHQEQMLLREKLKAKSAPTQVKEARLSGNIEKHDLEVKRRHLQDWFREGGAQVHVRVTVTGTGKHQKPVTKEQQLAVIHQLMAGLEDRVMFASKPRDVGKDGMNLTVTLRRMSAKEKTALVKQKNKEESLNQQRATDSRDGGEENEQTDDKDEKVG
ncbi:translation initiation factor IF-3, mitochondrial-like [Patiria miniata]|uniref:Translation initiation factor 3 N-terminal domain-containing protein n=1 Tax=Patiria miniata TaxID=46514 RepID=A0A913ZUM9_PATMI|nr:translation initiation factor IF-3, mitochondrial-like [Patiria miniata]XP_038055268.1 translation initiation factor IF-3, mitochondrial-like [Patiria miniata]XP_038055269.1 translation initiation factor IF-3, mitochondrial-like [Patiria miniata]XP_038055270.1 translation initiation factor IF-3, mitochondrial-like [Patiria miniata]